MEDYNDIRKHNEARRAHIGASFIQTTSTEKAQEKPTPKPQVQEDKFSKSIAVIDDYLEKGKKAPIGTVSGAYKKVAEGKWKKVREEGGKSKSSKDNGITRHKDGEEIKFPKQQGDKHSVQYSKKNDSYQIMKDGKVVGDSSSKINAVDQAMELNAEERGIQERNDKAAQKKREDNPGVPTKKGKKKAPARKKSTSQINPSKQSKKELYSAVNKKYGTSFKPGDIEEFEDDDFRTQLGADDIESIVNDEKGIENLSAEEIALLSKYAKEANSGMTPLKVISKEVMEEFGVDKRTAYELLVEAEDKNSKKSDVSNSPSKGDSVSVMGGIRGNKKMRGEITKVITNPNAPEKTQYKVKLEGGGDALYDSKDITVLKEDENTLNEKQVSSLKKNAKAIVKNQSVGKQSLTGKATIFREDGKIQVLAEVKGARGISHRKIFETDFDETQVEQVRDVLSDEGVNVEYGAVLQRQLKKSLSIIEDYLEKGGKRATIGERRDFGGRTYIKTAQGWKYHGKGKGEKTKQHRKEAAEKLKEKRSASNLPKEGDAVRVVQEGANLISLEPFEGKDLKVEKIVDSGLISEPKQVKVTDGKGNSIIVSPKNIKPVKSKGNSVKSPKDGEEIKFPKDKGDKHSVKYSKKNDTFQIWKDGKLVDDSTSKINAVDEAMRLNALEKDSNQVKSTGKKLKTVSENYDWGRLVKVEQGNSWKAILHPEHQEMIAELNEGESRGFTDEQGMTWDVTKTGDTSYNIKQRGKGKKGHFEMSAPKKSKNDKPDVPDVVGKVTNSTKEERGEGDKKPSAADLMKPMKGKEYQIEPTGTGDFKQYVLEAQDGSHLVDMRFSSREEAEKFASKRGFPTMNRLDNLEKELGKAENKLGRAKQALQDKKDADDNYSANSNDLEAIKEAEQEVKRLEKEVKKEKSKKNDINKAIANLDDYLEKGKKAEIGETREWNGKKMKKTSDGWVPVKGEGKSSKKEEGDKKSKKGDDSSNKPSEIAIEAMKEKLIRGKRVYNNNLDNPEKRKEAAQALQTIFEELQSAGLYKDAEPFWSEDLKDSKKEGDDKESSEGDSGNIAFDWKDTEGGIDQLKSFVEDNGGHVTEGPVEGEFLLSTEPIDEKLIKDAMSDDNKVASRAMRKLYENPKVQSISLDDDQDQIVDAISDVGEMMGYEVKEDPEFEGTDSYAFNLKKKNE